MLSQLEGAGWTCHEVAVRRSTRAAPPPSRTSCQSMDCTQGAHASVTKKRSQRRAKRYSLTNG